MLSQLAILGSAVGGILWYKQKKGNSRALDKNTPSSNKKKQNFDHRRFARDLAKALVGSDRQQQRQSLSSRPSHEMDQFKKNTRRNIFYYALATGAAVLGHVYPVFSLLGIAGVLYLARNLFGFIRLDFQRGRYITIYLFSAILTIGMIFTGNLIVAAITGIVGSFLLQIIKRVEDDAQAQLTQVFSWHPERVWIEKNGVETQVDFESLQKGDVVIVNAGEVIPVDGEVTEGYATVDQHVLTGESQPVDKSPGEQVFATTLLLSGRLAIRLEKDAQDTVAANIAHVLENTQNYKDNLLVRGREIADGFLPVQGGLSLLTWAAAGATPALGILWSGLGANMAIMGPLSVLNYLHILSQRGVLIKDGRVFESLRQVDTVIFDKTGTLTLEQPEVGEIHVFEGYDEETVLRYAAIAEARQSHPIACAILERAAALGLEVCPSGEADYTVGYGIQVSVEERLVRVGSERYMHQQGVALTEALAEVREYTAEQGYSLIHVAIDGQLVGVLEMRPSIRPEAREVVGFLKQRGIELYIISGDHEHPTRHLARELGIDHYFAEVLPQSKAAKVQQLREAGRFVCFMGDGINDAIALKSAQVSISLKGASTVATDTAQIVLMDGTMGHLPIVFTLSDEFEQTMHRNLVSSLLPGALNIGGVLLLHISLGTSVAIFYLGSLAGMGISLMPLARHQNPSPELVTEDEG